MQRTCLILLCVLALAGSHSTAQEDQSFSAQVTLVRVPTPVQNSSGELVSGLQAADFIIRRYLIRSRVSAERDGKMEIPTK